MLFRTWLCTARISVNSATDRLGWPKSARGSTSSLLTHRACSRVYYTEATKATKLFFPHSFFPIFCGHVLDQSSPTQTSSLRLNLHSDSLQVTWCHPSHPRSIPSSKSFALELKTSNSDHIFVSPSISSWPVLIPVFIEKPSEMSRPMFYRYVSINRYSK